MNSYNHIHTDDENIDEADEDFGLEQSHRISNSIHNFAEIMSSDESKKHSDRFSAHYNPRRRKLLTETDHDNINDGTQNQLSHRARKYNYYQKLISDENKPIQEINYSDNEVQEVDEEVYEEISSQFMNSVNEQSRYDEATFSPSNRPSSNKNTTTGKLKNIEQKDSSVPEIRSSDEK